MPIGVLVNHLLEPPNRRSGISAYLFSLLAELIRNPDFRYTLATTWEAGRLPAALREGPLEVVTLPYKARQVENVLRQVVHVPRLLRRTGAVLEFNPNPVGQPVPFRPRVTVVHDLYFETMPALFSPRHVFWWRRLFPPSLRTARATICVSGQTRDELVRGHPRAVRKAVVVHEAPCLSVTGGPHPHGGRPTRCSWPTCHPTRTWPRLGRRSRPCGRVAGICRSSTSATTTPGAWTAAAPATPVTRGWCP